MHHREGRCGRAVIAEHEPDIVIYEMAERGLRWKLEREPAKPWRDAGFLADPELAVSKSGQR